ncbi:MAG: CotH kinase family protein, partial [Spirochaetia bacterium]
LNHRLMDSEEVRHELLQRFAVHLATTAREERALELVDRHAARIEAEMPRQIARWGGPGSMDAWRASIEDMREFARRRPDILRGHLQDFFDDVTGGAELTVEGLTPAAGVSLHTVELEAGTEGVVIRDGRWSGPLFTGVPVVLESRGSDLREAAFASERSVEVVERSRERLSVYLLEDTVLTLPETPE